MRKTIVSVGFILALWGIIMIGGCSKKKDEVAPTIPNYSTKIKTIIDLTFPTLRDTFVYDSQGRQISKSSLSNSYVNKYTYSNNKVIVDEIVASSGGGGTDHYYGVYTLNTQGYASSLDISRDGGAIETTTFTYDANGHMISSVSYAPDTNTLYGIYDTTIQTWSNGNLTKHYRAICFDGFSRHTDITTYTYLSDKKNTIGNENKGLSWLGKSSVNLVNTYSLNGGAPVSAKYEYDSQNRVTKLLYDGVMYSINGIYTYY